MSQCKTATRKGEARAWLEAYIAQVGYEDAPAECILWPFNVGGGGYPRIWREGRHIRATRHIMERLGVVFSGPDEVVRHTCDVPRCVNFAHLETGTPADNVRDREERGRGHRPKGEKNPRARLTADDVCAIRGLLTAGETQAAISRQFGIDPSAISFIRSGRNWAHV